MPKLTTPADLEELRKSILSKRDPEKLCISICGGTDCHTGDNLSIIGAFEEEIKEQSLQDRIDIKVTGCPGFCDKGPLVIIYPEEICYLEVTQEDVSDIVSQTLVKKKVVNRLVYTDSDTGEKSVHINEIPFFKNQMRVLLGNSSMIKPASFDDYLAMGGYSALTKTIQNMSPEQVIEEVKKSGLRGRSGGGFPVGRKWEAGRNSESATRYIICNCHEGDPGAFVDRRMLEGNPHSVIEGMIIGAYAIGANKGHIFVGDEIPLAVENAEIAIKQAEEHELLGKNILGSGFDLTIEINLDGGGYVCGESTALTASLEGRVGEPITKYDHATERGLWGKPTVLNNLQTWVNIPLIINKGADVFNKTGTENSKGTRVFSLTGKINNIGMVEAPMGMTVKEIVYEVGGGIRNGKKLKAVQAGGPLGGFVPESLLDLPVDYEEMTGAGVSMGPSLVVIDEDTCMVDMVKYFIEFLCDESCGKCTPCREGLRQMLWILTNISEGKGRDEDIELLLELSEVQKEAALCALGQGASNPLLSTLKHFRDEFEAHIKDKQCPTMVCKMIYPVESKK